MTVILDIAPALKPEQVLAMPVGQAFDLMGGRARVNRAAEAEADRRSGASAGGGMTTQSRPDGSKVYRIEGEDGMRTLMKMMQAGQAKKTD